MSSRDHWMCAIDEGGPPRLELRRGPGGFPIELLLDGAPLAPPIDRAALADGLDVALPDGRTVRIAPLGSRDLTLTLDGRAPPGGGVHAHTGVFEAVGVVVPAAVVYAIALALPGVRHGPVARIVVDAVLLAINASCVGAILRWRAPATMLAIAGVQAAACAAVIAVAVATATTWPIWILAIHAFAIRQLLVSRRAMLHAARTHRRLDAAEIFG